MRSRLRAAAICASAFLCDGAAAAFEGRYVAGSKSYSQEVRIAKRADGRYQVKADVATRGCAGEVDGVGVPEGDALKATVAFEGETCALILRRTKKGLGLEEDHCLAFHGAACEFSGDYRKR